MNSAQYLTLPSPATAQATACNMLSATVQMQYYHSPPAGYGMPPRCAMPYYGALTEPLPSPTFLPTPPLPSPLSLYSRPQFFPTHVHSQYVQAHLQKAVPSSEAAVALLSLHEPIVHSEASPTENGACKVISPIKTSPVAVTPPACAEINVKPEGDSCVSPCASTDQGYVSRESVSLGQEESGDYATHNFVETPSGGVTPFPTYSHALTNPRPAYSHAIATSYPSYPSPQVGFTPVRYPAHPTHIQSLPYFPTALRREETFPRNNSCHICGKTYARQSTLKTHLRTHNGEKPYQCSICQKSFTQAANLTAHLRTHSGEKPFKCPVCSRGFSQSSSVTTHMRTHSGERPYKCNVCGKGFADSSTLTKHYRTHTGEKPYQCKVCDARFSQSGNLNRHMRTHRNHFQGPQVVPRAQ